MNAAARTAPWLDAIFGSAHVRPTLEVILTESPTHLRKRLDPDSGLALIKPQAETTRA